MNIIIQLTTFCLSLIFISSISLAQVSSWQSIPSGTGKNLNSILQAGTYLVATGDDGAYVFHQPSTGITVNGQTIGVNQFVSAEKLRIGSGSYRCYSLTDNKLIFRIDTSAASLLPDSLPELPTGNCKTKRLIDLNISGVDQLRYGFPMDSGRILACKIPYTNTRLEFQLPFSGQINDLVTYSSWGVIAAGDSGRIWRTVGLDQNFIPVNQAHHSKNINRLIKTGASRFAAIGNEGTVLTSTDNGLNWSLMETPVQDHFLGGIQEGVWLVLFTSGGEIWSTDDNGQTWLEELSSSAALRSITRGPDGILYCAGDNGKIWKRTSLTTSIEADRKKAKLSIQLRGRTMESMENSDVKFRLTELSGRMISNGSLSAGRQQEVSCTPGLYFVEFSASDGRVQRQRMLIPE